MFHRLTGGRFRAAYAALTGPGGTNNVKVDMFPFLSILTKSAFLLSQKWQKSAYGGDGLFVDAWRVK